MCASDGADPGDGFPGVGAGCCAASGAGFRDVAQALRAARVAAAYLNSPAAAGALEGPARGEALEALAAIGSLLGAATNSILRRFDADDDHDADGTAAAAWSPREPTSAARTRKPPSGRCGCWAATHCWTPRPPVGW
jgi:hypothetical protein